MHFCVNFIFKIKKIKSLTCTLFTHIADESRSVLHPKHGLGSTKNIKN